MSRIGNKVITVPAKVKVNLSGSGETGMKVQVEGPAGSLSHTFPEGVSIHLEGTNLTVARASDQKRHRAFHGTTRAVVANMVTGCEKGWVKVLEIHGTGFGAVVQGDKIELDLGFSNKVYVKIPSDLEVKAVKGRPTKVTIKGADKSRVGQLAAVIRSKRPPTPYSDNKGVRYVGEVIRKKAGKAFGDKK
jgi:large subunit ribosomal protein L6